jgi:hypothetical protein
MLVTSMEKKKLEKKKKNIGGNSSKITSFLNFSFYFLAKFHQLKKKRLQVWNMDPLVYLPRDLLYNTRGSNHRYIP